MGWAHDLHHHEFETSLGVVFHLIKLFVGNVLFKDADLSLYARLEGVFKFLLNRLRHFQQVLELACVRPMHRSLHMRLWLLLVILFSVDKIVFHEAQVALDHPHLVLLLPCHVLELRLVDVLLGWLAVDLFVRQLAHLLVAAFDDGEQALHLHRIQHEVTDQLSVVVVRLGAHRLDGVFIKSVLRSYFAERLQFVQHFFNLYLLIT